jgi:NAD(P)H-hydrate epimerase
MNLDGKIPPLKRDQVREVDRIAIEEYGIPGVVLMENAGRGCAEQIANFAPRGAPVCVLCGPGNNGGDGYVIARHLQLLDHDVRIVSLKPLDELSGDAAINASVAAKAELPIDVAEDPQTIEACLPSGATVVDCLLGTGATGEPRGLFGDAVRIANQRTAKRIAIDIPTGLDCDSGEPAETTFRADLTLTFVAPKAGFANPDAEPFLGRIEVIEIGVPKKLLTRFGLK